jgi:hypothetical protein
MTPPPVIENDDVKLYYNWDIITDRFRPNNRPDITVQLKQERITHLIDVSIPNTENLDTKYREKIQKYSPIAEEIKEIWKQKYVKIVPIVISATGVIPKNLLKSLESIGIDHKLYIQIQKTTIINTCSIVRRFLNENSWWA